MIYCKTHKSPKFLRRITLEHCHMQDVVVFKNVATGFMVCPSGIPYFFAVQKVIFDIYSSLECCACKAMPVNVILIDGNDT